MEVVYLFCESNVVRVPFYAYNLPLFHLFIAGGGRWDRENRQFIFRQNPNADFLKRIAIDTPCVFVKFFYREVAKRDVLSA